MIVTVASVASNWPQKATPRCLRVNETIPGACSSAATPVMWSRRSIPKGLGNWSKILKFLSKRISWYLQTVTSPKGPWACSPLVPSLTSDWLKWLCPPVGRYCLGKSWKLKTNALECIDDLEAKRFKEPKEVEDLNEDIAIKQTVQFKSVHLPTSQEQFTEQPPGALQAAVSLPAPMHSWWANGQFFWMSEILQVGLVKIRAFQFVFTGNATHCSLVQSAIPMSIIGTCPALKGPNLVRRRLLVLGRISQPLPLKSTECTWKIYQTYGDKSVTNQKNQHWQTWKITPWKVETQQYLRHLQNY